LALIADAAARRWIDVFYLDAGLPLADGSGTCYSWLRAAASIAQGTWAAADYVTDDRPDSFNAEACSLRLCDISVTLFEVVS